MEAYVAYRGPGPSRRVVQSGRATGVHQSRRVRPRSFHRGRQVASGIYLHTSTAPRGGGDYASTQRHVEAEVTRGRLVGLTERRRRVARRRAYVLEDPCMYLELVAPLEGHPNHG